MGAYDYFKINTVNIPDLPGVKVNSLNYHNRASRLVTRKRVPRANKQKVTNVDESIKEIAVRITLSADTKEQFEQRRDTLLRYLAPVESVIELMQSGTARQYQGTIDDFNWDETPYALMGQATFVIVCSDPFGRATVYATARELTGITVANTTNGINEILGSYKVPTKITVTINSVTGGTSKYIRLVNPATGKQIQINGDFANSDVFIIDGDAMTVTKNGVTCDFTGVFLEFDPGWATLQWLDTLTSRNVTIKVEYKRRDF